MKAEALRNSEEVTRTVEIQQKLERIQVSLIAKLSNKVRDCFDELLEKFRQVDVGLEKLGRNSQSPKIEQKLETIQVSLISQLSNTIRDSFDQILEELRDPEVALEQRGSNPAD